jgi:hypothetical protein
MTEQNTLSSWPPLSLTKANPKRLPTVAYARHIALINRRGSSLLQRFVLQKTQPTHKPTQKISLVHAPFTTHPMRHIHRPIGCCGASCRGFGQQRRGVAAIYADMPPLGRLRRRWQPLHVHN